jgi:hypothetical protein
MKRKYEYKPQNRSIKTNFLMLSVLLVKTLSIELIKTYFQIQPLNNR